MNRNHATIGIAILGLLLALAAGPNAILAGPRDFDGDGYTDLAIGVPYENVGEVTDAGSVTVVYGTSTGLSGTADEYWIQNYVSGGASEPYEYFGRALAVGDFDGDGFHDLAVGVSHEDVDGVNQAGAVSVIYGSAIGGLDVSGSQVWTQDEDYMAGAAETGDHFGWALAAGDFDADGYDDLAIGVPDEDIGDVVDAGGVQVMLGSAGGLTPIGDIIWDQGGGAEAGDQHGKALATGDFDDDGYDDLAVAAPSEDLGSIANAGMVQIYYGSADGLTNRVSNDFWHQDRSGVPDTAEEHDLFGSSLAAADFNGDGYVDLAVGVPYEDTGDTTVADAGAVSVLYGSPTGVVGSGSDVWHQDSDGVGSITEESDRFGFSLAAGDFDSDGYADLAVGVPYEHWNDADTGIVQVLHGAADGISASGDQLWRQDVTGIDDEEEPDDRYGYALAAGDLDGDGYVDLAVGVPYEAIGSTDQAGAVNVLYGSHLGLTALGSQFWYQGSGGLQGTPETGDRFGHALAALPRARSVVYLPLILMD